MKIKPTRHNKILHLFKVNFEPKPITAGKTVGEEFWCSYGRPVG